jgi:hypothetical protein
MVIDFCEEIAIFQELLDFEPRLAGGKACDCLNDALIDVGSFEALWIEQGLTVEDGKAL